MLFLLVIVDFTFDQTGWRKATGHKGIDYFLHEYGSINKQEFTFKYIMDRVIRKINDRDLSTDT